MTKRKKTTWLATLIFKGIFIAGVTILLFPIPKGPYNAMAQGMQGKTAPPISCAGCHSFQAKLFKDYPSGASLVILNFRMNQKARLALMGR